MADNDTCALCGEEEPHPLRTATIMTPDGPRPTHPECMVRSVTGGIGHLIAHNYWCVQMGDPDAGLTFRQSAKLANEYWSVVGHTHHTEEVR